MKFPGVASWLSKTTTLAILAAVNHIETIPDER